jgi:hypothetical protein
MEWNEANNNFPEEFKAVLCQIAPKDNAVPAAVAVGYVQKDSEENPSWVIPGVGGTVTHWSDSLPEDFKAPLWS